MKILGVEIDFSFTNGDNMKKFEDNYSKVIEVTQSFNGSEKLSDILNKTCNAIDDFFNNVFGSDISKKLFKNNDLKERVIAFKELKEERDRQEEEFNHLMKVFTIDTEKAEMKYSKNRTRK